MKRTAQYRCDQCSHKWTLNITNQAKVETPTEEDEPEYKDFNPADTCPNCKSKYFKWTNYKRLEKARMFDRFDDAIMEDI